MRKPDDRTDRWLVVGAGPSGLSVSLALQQAGVAFEGIEAGATVGGMWNMDNPGSGMYESAHFISSAARSGWADLPMPDHYPTYPAGGRSATTSTVGPPTTAWAATTRSTRG